MNKQQNIKLKKKKKFNENKIVFKNLFEKYYFVDSKIKNYKSTIKNLNVYNGYKICKKKLIHGIIKNIIDDKTISVVTMNLFKHKKYLKYIKRYKIFLVHNPTNIKLNIGDNITFFFTKHISKKKYSILFNVFKKKHT